MNKNMILLKTFMTTVLCSLSLWPTMAEAQNNNAKYVLVYYDKGKLDVFPESLVASRTNTHGQLCVTTVSDTTFYYNESRIDSVAVRTKAEIDGRLPSITQLKLNNKYNDQVYTDVFANIVGDSLITAEIGAIGKWLTPSIQLSDEAARVYIGHERQEDKKSRRSFAKDVYYTVAQPNQRIFEHTLVKDEIWSEAVGEYTDKPVALTADMFSTNLPGQSFEGFEQMLDGNISTCFHSTWNVTSQEEKQKIYATHPYIDIALPQQMRLMRFAYTTRATGSYWPLSLTLSASNDGSTWTEIKTFTTADGLPTAAAADFRSDVIDLGRNYTYLRLYLNDAAYRLYMVFAEFQLFDVVRNTGAHDSELIQPAEYKYQMNPFGRKYRVHIDWLTDRSTNVPTVNIDVEDGRLITSKKNFVNATITIDGAAVFPSMEPTEMQIRGRGNTSWQSYDSWYDYWYELGYSYYGYKNPYRMKFPEKRKPFGLTNGKNWVLLANKQTGSMMTNAIGMKAACLVGTEGANHIVPVELYLNGTYYGNYNFTEKVGLSNNSIELADESRATLLELDTYFDETYKFTSDPYKLPVNIKEPEFDEEGSTLLTQELIEREFNYFMQVVKDGRKLSDIVDIESLAKYLMLNDLIANHEIKHPKSTFLYNPGVMTAKSKFYFGPVWDLDWAFGYETNRTYFTAEQTIDLYNSKTFAARQFISDLRYVSTDLDKAYYRIWKHFVEHQLDELIDFCDDYYAYARPSLEHNADFWADGLNYESIKENAKKWLRARAESVFSKLTPYDVPDDGPIIDSFDEPGDVSGIVIDDKTKIWDEGSLVDVYDLNGRCVKRRASAFDLRTGLKPGIYIVNGKKMVIQ
ncbi:MAG: CotH kinase family protein [Prevotella sp.]|nr:CotH kinase family protein [Prevotella sp.]